MVFVTLTSVCAAGALVRRLLAAVLAAASTESASTLGGRPRAARCSGVSSAPSGASTQAPWSHSHLTVSA